MNCQDRIISEDIYDYILEDIPGIMEDIKENAYGCAERINSQWIIAHGELPIERELNISSLGYYTIPKLFGLMQNDEFEPDTTAVDEIGATNILNQEYLNASGQGILLGFVDTGIDYLKDNFTDSLNKTKIEAIWDQTIESSEDSTYLENVTVPYGSLYFKKDIDIALNEYRNGNNPYSIVPSRDFNGHGTMMAGISASKKIDGFTGAAPDAGILMVKLKEAKKYLKDYYLVNDNTNAYSEADIMLGIKFLIDYAGSVNKPIVIIVGLGSANGSRTGGSPLGDYLDSLTKRPSTAVVVCVGNEANERTHYKGNISSVNTPDICEINVEKEGRGFCLEIWAESLDVLSVSIESPSGETIPRIPVRLGVSVEYAFLYEGTKITIDYQIVERIAGLEVVFIRFIAPTPGIWKVYVYSLTNIKGTYNAWLPLKAFSGQQVFFLKPDPDITLTTPSATERVISVGSYNHYTGGNDYESGRGFSASDAIKPDVVAPGVNVYGPRTGAGYTRKSGTSFAAAYTGACVALIFSWAISNKKYTMLGNAQAKANIIRGAKRLSNMVYPNRMSGYGKLDIVETFNTMRIS